MLAEAGIEYCHPMQLGGRKIRVEETTMAFGLFLTDFIGGLRRAASGNRLSGSGPDRHLQEKIWKI